MKGHLTRLTGTDTPGHRDGSRADKGRGLMVTDGQGLRAGNFEHFKTTVSHSRNGTVGHCITSLNTYVRR